MDCKYLKEKAKVILKEHFWFLLAMIVIFSILSLEMFGFESKQVIVNNATTWEYYAKVFNFEFQIPSAAFITRLVGSYAIFSLAMTVFVGNVLRYGLSNVFKYTSMHRKDEFHLFKGFKDNYTNVLIVNLMKSIQVCLFSLLFVIPGIYKMYQYSFVNEILEEHPDWDYKMVFEESKRITKDHILDLFILDLSFIGWEILASLFSVLTLGLSSCAVKTYRYATYTQAYFLLTNKDTFYNHGIEVEATYM